MAEVFGIELGGSQLWAAIDVEGTAPTLDLVLGYLKANTSLPLKFFLSRSGLADRSCVEKVCGAQRQKRNQGKLIAQGPQLLMRFWYG